MNLLILLFKFLEEDGSLKKKLLRGVFFKPGRTAQGGSPFMTCFVWLKQEKIQKESSLKKCYLLL